MLNEISFRIKPYLWVSKFDIYQSKSEIMVDWCLGLQYFLPGFLPGVVGLLEAMPNWGGGSWCLFPRLQDHSGKDLRDLWRRLGAMAMPCTILWYQNSWIPLADWHRIGQPRRWDGVFGFRWSDQKELVCRSRQEWHKNATLLPLFIASPEKLR